MHLLYLTFGSNAAIHAQASFSIYTFLRATTTIRSINILTDAPDFYRHLGNSVKVMPLSKDQLRDWEGEQQFFWRVKLKAIEQVCQLYPGEPVMYLDSDTFLMDDLATLQSNLQTGKALMHLNEGPLSKKKSKTEKKMWHQVQGKPFGGIIMQPTDCMWNAGVVAIPNTLQNAECRLALTICDEMCRQGVTRRLVEQYALALALQKTYGLGEAQNEIVHYWQVKDIWNGHINQFFLQAHFSQWTFEETIRQVARFNFAALPVALSIRNTNRRLKKWIDKLYPSKNPVYLPAPK